MKLRSWLVLALGIVVVVAPELQELGSAEAALSWENLWHLIHVAAGGALVRLSGHQWEKAKGFK